MSLTQTSSLRRESDRNFPAFPQKVAAQLHLIQPVVKRYIRACGDDHDRVARIGAFYDGTKRFPTECPSLSQPFIHDWEAIRLIHCINACFVLDLNKDPRSYWPIFCGLVGEYIERMRKVAFDTSPMPECSIASSTTPRC